MSYGGGYGGGRGGDRGYSNGYEHSNSGYGSYNNYSHSSQQVSYGYDDHPLHTGLASESWFLHILPLALFLSLTSPRVGRVRRLRSPRPLM